MKITNQIIIYPKNQPINESIKFGNKFKLRLGSNDFKKPSIIKGYVISFGIIKCFRSIKKIIKKPILRIKNRIVVDEKPNK